MIHSIIESKWTLVALVAGDDSIDSAVEWCRNNIEEADWDYDFRVVGEQWTDLWYFVKQEDALLFTLKWA